MDTSREEEATEANLELRYQQRKPVINEPISGLLGTRSLLHECALQIYRGFLWIRAESNMFARLYAARHVLLWVRWTVDF